MRPSIVGVVNLTPDSFSDGGRYLEPAAALAHARQLLDDGADLVELGPASSHPDADGVAPAEEIRRLEAVLGPLLASGAAVGVDTFQPETQRWALARGVGWLNDIQGFPEPELYPDLARAQARLVVMHSVQRRGRASRMRTAPAAVLAGVEAFLRERVAALAAAGVARGRLILDPGMGFFLGSDPEPSVLALRRLRKLRAELGLPILVSVSRKSFLGALTGRPVGERGAATLAAELFAARQGADYVRTHDVRALRDALVVTGALEG